MESDMYLAELSEFIASIASLDDNETGTASLAHFLHCRFTTKT